MSPQWLLRLTRGGFVGFLARWWWGRRRAGAPLRLWLRRALVAAADRELQLTRRARTAATCWIRFRRAVNSAWVRGQIQTRSESHAKKQAELAPVRH